MRRTHMSDTPPLHRSLTLTAVLALVMLAGCEREGQTDRLQQNETRVPGEATSTATPDTDYTNDDPGEDAADGEETESVRPSPPQTIVVPEPEPEESEDSGSGSAEH